MVSGAVSVLTAVLSLIAKYVSGLVYAWLAGTCVLFAPGAPQAKLEGTAESCWKLTRLYVVSTDWLPSNNYAACSQVKLHNSRCNLTALPLHYITPN